MINKTNKLLKNCTLFAFGGALYSLIEVFSRGYSHWSMMVLGGICFILIGWINEYISWEISIITQMAIGSIIITTLEFITGCIVNLWLNWNVWDYSCEWGNVLGQICPKYSLYWFFLSFVGILLDDIIRWLVFNEEKPRYKI